MELKLLSLKVANFKGIRAFEIQPNGNNLKVKGKNERGKTSLYDAFLWLLFGKNSAGETKFGVKPNNSPDGIEPTVTAIFSVDGRELELKKVLAAKFAKDTGEFNLHSNMVRLIPRLFLIARAALIIYIPIW